MKHRSDVSILFPQFKSLVEKYHNALLISLFTETSGEYVPLTKYLQEQGISHFTTPPHSPEQNRVAERRHRHILETGLSLLHHVQLPLTFWSYAFQTAHLINRLPTSILHHKSPYQQLYHNPPTYTKLKHYGCLCFPWLIPYVVTKLHPHSAKCIFLGYSSLKFAYKCYDRISQKLYHSRYVEFIENTFPYHTAEPPSTPSTFPTTNEFLLINSTYPLTITNQNFPSLTHHRSRHSSIRNLILYCTDFI